jgi:hypothetical protein
VHVAVIRDRDRRHLELRRSLEEMIDPRRAIQK